MTASQQMSFNSVKGLCFSEVGKAYHVVHNDDITYGGKGPVVNPSGGLIYKGHPLGATGLAQCAELTWQLKWWANNGGLVKDADVALQHNIGLRGTTVVTVYKRANGKKNTDARLNEANIVRISGVVYNPAVEARYISRGQADSVRSKNGRCDYALDNTVD
jgi:sterol carrier protein 2